MSKLSDLKAAVGGWYWKIRDGYDWLMSIEPARVTAVKTSLVAALALLPASGLTDLISTKAAVITTAAITALLFLHSEFVRRVVYAPESVFTRVQIGIQSALEDAGVEMTEGTISLTEALASLEPDPDADFEAAGQDEAPTA